MVRLRCKGRGLLLVAVLALWTGRASGEEPPEALQDCGLEPPSSIPPAPVPPKRFELPASSSGGRFQVAREDMGRGALLHGGVPHARLRTGALSGKAVYVSAGHGFYWSPGLGRWATQRGNTFDIVEDLVSTETVSQYLVPMLINAGAYVVPVRETDLNRALVIVDNQDADYSESGDAAAFSNSSVQGYGHPTLPLVNGVNPFSLGNNRLMEATVSTTPTAHATWVLNVPEDGAYNVYVTYTQFSYRVPDAHFAVRHAGGEAHFRINQRRHGSTWVLLGRFYFRAGKDPDRGAVVAFNDSSVQGNVSLDAVRIGGGMGLSAGNNPDGTTSAPSGRPRFEECARYHAQFLGAPTSVYDNASLADRDDDVSARSRFVAWEHEAGEDAVYVAWHTNACGTTTCTARGTWTYVYGPNPPDGTYNFTGTPGSDVLAQAVHGEIIRDLRAGWDPNWRDRSIDSAYFGELNPNHNPETPAILLEMAFHNTLEDAEVLKEPRFRYIAARAITQGIIKYFAQKDGTAVILPPEPPVELSARNLGGGWVRLSWRPAPVDAQDLGGHAATGFRVYTSTDGLAWDDGTPVTGVQHQIVVPAGEARYFRVTATNAGGESFPSEVLGVGVPVGGGLAPVLVVNAYERLDAALASTEDLSPFSLGSPLRVFLERMNDRTYVRRHGAALHGNAVSFDSASAAVIAAGRVDLSQYKVIDWFVGRGVSATVQIPEEHQARLRAFVEGGGRLLISGSHVASGLAAGGTGAQAFLAQVLFTGGATGGGGGTAIDGISGEALDGLNGITLDDGRPGSYPPGPTDVLTAAAGGVPLATWSGGANVAALRGAGSGEVALVAFPLETIVGEDTREEVMARLLTALSAPTAPLPWDGGLPPDEDAGMPLPPDPEPDAGTGPDPEPIAFGYMGATFPSADAGGCGCANAGAGGGGAAIAGLLGLLLWPVRRCGCRFYER